MNTNSRSFPHPSSRVKFSVSPSNQGELNGKAITNLWIPGLSQDIYQYYSTNIESTALALFALREAKNNQLLPEEVVGPIYKGRAIGKSINTESLFELSYSTLKKSWKNYPESMDSLWSMEAHRECRSSDVVERFDSKIYQGLKLPEDWMNPVFTMASISYLTELLGGRFVSDGTTISQQYTQNVVLSLRSNILNDLDRFLKRDPSVLYHISSVIEESELAMNTWHEIGGALIGSVNKSLVFDASVAYEPESAKLTRRVEQAVPKYIDVLTIPIEYEESEVELFGEMCWRSSLISFITQQPKTDSYNYWSPTSDYPLAEVFDKCSKVGGQDDLFGTVNLVAMDLDIREIYQVPYLYLDQSVSDFNLEANKEVIRDYMLNYGGTLVFDKNDHRLVKSVKEILSILKIDYLRVIPEKLGDDYQFYSSKEGQVYAVSIDLPKDDVRAQAKVIYRSNQAKVEGELNTFDSLDLTAGKLDLGLAE